MYGTHTMNKPSQDRQNVTVHLIKQQTAAGSNGIILYYFAISEAYDWELTYGRFPLPRWKKTSHPFMFRFSPTPNELVVVFHPSKKYVSSIHRSNPPLKGLILQQLGIQAYRQTGNFLFRACRKMKVGLYVWDGMGLGKWIITKSIPLYNHPSSYKQLHIKLRTLH